MYGGEPTFSAPCAVVFCAERSDRLAQNAEEPFLSPTRPIVVAPPGFTYDLSEWPIFVTVRTATPTAEAYTQHLAALDGMLARAEKQVHVIEVLPNAPADRAQMKMQAEWNDKRRDALGRHCLGVGMVLHSAIQRFGVAAMLTLTRQPVPYQVFSSRDEAVIWARQLLKKTSAR